MIKSVNRIKVLKLIHEHVVIPANIDLISKMVVVKQDHQENCVFIQNALKKLNNAGLISYVRIYNDHKTPNQKDAYIITKAGKKALLEAAKKYNLEIQRHESIPDNVPSKRYDFYNRISTVKFYCFDIPNAYFYTRFQIFELYGEELTDEFKELRFHGVMITRTDIMPIYYIRNNIMNINYYKERKFFELLKEKLEIENRTFTKILIADDERIFKKIMNQTTAQNNKCINNTNKYIVNILRSDPQERNYLVTLTMEYSVRRYLSNIEQSNQRFKERIKKEMTKYGNAEIFNSLNDNNRIVCFHDVKYLQHLYLETTQNTPLNNLKKLIIHTARIFESYVKKLFCNCNVDIIIWAKNQDGEIIPINK